MRSGSVASGHVLTFAAGLLAACQSVIGISGYEIDETLDEGTAATWGDSAGTANGGEGGGGQSPNSGEAGSGAAQGGVGTGGETLLTGGGGQGGGPECAAAADCDDAIDCTLDSCSSAGSCLHEPDTSACLANPGECLQCRVGIGCVATDPLTEELLLDPSFDEQTGDWVEYSDNYENNIFAGAGAQSGTRFAKLGPAPAGATKQEYADLLQYVLIPQRASSLTLTGYYRVNPGATNPAGDYAVAALYEPNAVDPSIQFRSWDGGAGAEPAWQSFRYSAPRSDLSELAGQELTFDLVAHTFGTVYEFDTLSLTATICEP